MSLLVGCASSGNNVGNSSGGGSNQSDAGPDTSVQNDGGNFTDASFGDGNIGNDGGSKSCPSTCQDLGANCGPVTDTKCGGIVQCGTCPSGQACGAGGPNKCGTGSTGDGGTCTPKTCADLGVNCGKVLDGCGTLIDCGSCPSGQGCGVGGQANVCGNITPDGGTCTPKTCAQQNINCGPAGDGCGGTLSCGTCSSGQTCGGGGTPGQCGKPACIPLTCASQKISCGPAGDGCGGTLNCGSCSLPQTCGGGSTPGQCGCSGVCAQIPTCGSGKTTTLSGKVLDPAGVNPLYNVLVYIPNNPSDPNLKSFPVGPTCDVCGATAAGDPLVTTHTATDGTFTLSGVPVGSSIPVVIQLGRWRRMFNVNISNSCGANTVSGGQLLMPRNKSEGNIPLTAIVTGDADAMECVFKKMGIDQAEFTNPSGAGRIHIYQGDVGGTFNIPIGYLAPTDRGFTNCNIDPFFGGGTCQYHGGGARIDSSTPSETALFQSTTMNNYDMVIMSCQGAAPFSNSSGTITDPSLSQYSKLVSYTNTGGRMFATHFSYTYLTQGGSSNPFYGTANWDLGRDLFTSATAVIDTNTSDNPKGPDFAKWMQTVGALSSNNPPSFTVGEPRWDVDSVIPPSQQWMTWKNPQGGQSTSKNQSHTLHYTFNTPIGAQSSKQCGRGLFSDFHVVLTTSGSTTGTYNQTFPTECDSGPMTAQEKALEFMIFDLGSCVQPYTPLCTPTTCAAQNIKCGPAGDGCGGLLDCGTCPSGQTCGGGGVPGQCGGGCTPQTCAQQNIGCGPAGDGCGGSLDCGTCPSGQTCGGGGVPGQCGAPDGGTCTAQTCAQQNIGCGPAGDGCGGSLDCGTCPSGQTCGGGGTPGQCGTPACTPQTCAGQNIDCGPAGDGCGGTLDCGNCPTGQVCGLNSPGKCGSVN